LGVEFLYEAECANEERKFKTAMDKSGKVLGQLTNITRQTEQGSSEAMMGVENALAGIDAANQELQKVKSAGNLEGLPAIETKLQEATDCLYNCMAAFQFQDITTQKLQKVMAILAELNDYLNELLGVPEPRPEWMAPKNIEKVELIKDEKKVEVDSLVNQFKSQVQGQ
jgi:chemotaxis regulatin CheY-phosphate phosphatase CheZ